MSVNNNNNKNISIFIQAFFEREIATLERAIGLGSGWTASQLAKKRQLQRNIEEISSDKERRQQDLDQLRRENEAGRLSTTRTSDALEATADELEKVQVAISVCEAQVAEAQLAKIRKQEEMRDL